MKKTTYDPLTALMELYQDRKVASREVDRSALTVEERLKQRIIDGDRIGLDDDLAEALRSHPPLTIINTFLLDGMTHPSFVAAIRAIHEPALARITAAL